MRGAWVCGGACAGLIAALFLPVVTLGCLVFGAFRGLLARGHPRSKCGSLGFLSSVSWSVPVSLGVVVTSGVLVSTAPWLSQSPVLYACFTRGTGNRCSLQHGSNQVLFSGLCYRDESEAQVTALPAALL